MKTFVEEVREQCARNGDRPALCLGGVRGRQSVSYGALGQYIDNAAARLARLGVVPGALYGLPRFDLLIHIVLILALERLGAVTATVTSPAQFKLLNLAGLFAETDIPEAPCPVHRVSRDWLLPHNPPLPRPPLIARAPGDIVRVAFTSGSTGRPKAVAEKLAWLARRNSDQDLAFGPDFRRFTRRLCCVGLDVLFGYRILMRTLSEGGLLCYPDEDEARGAKTLAHYGVQTVIGAPAQLAVLANYAEKNPGSLSFIQMVVCGGARLSPALAEKLRLHLCPRVLIAYGSSEGGIIASGDTRRLDLARGEVGHVVPSIELQLLDESSGEPVASGRGIVRMRGEAVMDGTYGMGAEQDGRYIGGWFYPGDIGNLSPDGMLSLLGRTDNVLNVSGVKTTVEAIEATLQSAPGVKEAALTVMADAQDVKRITVYVVPAANWSNPTFMSHCHANNLWPAKVILMDAMPYGPSGKIDRKRLPAPA